MNYLSEYKLYESNFYQQVDSFNYLNPQICDISEKSKSIIYNILENNGFVERTKQNYYELLYSSYSNFYYLEKSLESYNDLIVAFKSGVHISIHELKDEWFMVIIDDEFWKCDQIEGLIKILEDKNIIKDKNINEGKIPESNFYETDYALKNVCLFSEKLKFKLFKILDDNKYVNKQGNHYHDYGNKSYYINQYKSYSERLIIFKNTSELQIYPASDEWVYVKMGYHIWKCDQLDGLIKFLEDKRYIEKYKQILESDNRYKKLKSRYFTKRIDISKIDLENICNKLNLPFDKLSFLSSGSFGNAYKIGDKVLKITLDKSEAKTAYDITKNGQREGIVNYYKVVMYRLKNKYVYVILMEYVKPLSNPSSESIDVSSSFNYYDFVWDVTEIMYNNWTKIDSKEKFLELISDKYELPIGKFGNVILNRLFDLYQKVKKYKYVDIHPHNLGIRKDRSFVLFDFSEKKSVRKFDTPEIL